MTKIKLEDVTQEQWDQIEKLKIQWIEDQTKQYSDEHCQALVNEMYERLSLKPPKFIKVQSPIQIIERLRELFPDKKTIEKPYIGLWHRAYTGWYQGGKILGAKLDEDLLRFYTDWCNANSVCAAYEELCIVSDNPIEIKWNDGVLHNESGPSVLWKDGFALWSINGVAVDEQIVMAPETQTLEQIEKEGNADVKSIRIERYGWVKYIAESQAQLIDENEDVIAGGSIEQLYQLGDGTKRFIVNCPTGKIPCLGVPNNIQTCAQAQEYLYPFKTTGTRLFRT